MARLGSGFRCRRSYPKSPGPRGRVRGSAGRGYHETAPLFLRWSGGACPLLPRRPMAPESQFCAGASSVALAGRGVPLPSAG